MKVGAADEVRLDPDCPFTNIGEASRQAAWRELLNGALAQAILRRKLLLTGAEEGGDIAVDLPGPPDKDEVSGVVQDGETGVGDGGGRVLRNLCHVPSPFRLLPMSSG